MGATFVVAGLRADVMDSENLENANLGEGPGVTRFFCQAGEARGARKSVTATVAPATR